MNKIMLCCSAGMSTSMLVKKMQAAAEAEGIEATIEAYSAAEFDEKVDNFNVVLLGPQVRFMQKDLASRAEPKGIKVECISPMDYGTMNGSKVLKYALSLI